jgi:pimeloyl-ACP methyl ester carboxylesterase
MNDYGPLLQQITGDAFDIVSFDPRGVSRTTPQLLTFNTSAEESAFVLKTFEDPPLNATVDALARTYARFQAFGSLAQRRVAEVAPYVSTPLVARDMLAITQAFGREKLQYWGISYGTVLGATFAVSQGKEPRWPVSEVSDSRCSRTRSGAWSLTGAYMGSRTIASMC